jgi:hypothetical protein
MAVERRIELNRRYKRKAKMTKLKNKLGTATGDDRAKILAKIKRMSPLWTEAVLTANTTGEPKKKAAAKKKA